MKLSSDLVTYLCYPLLAAHSSDLWRGKYGVRKEDGGKKMIEGRRDSWLEETC